MQEVTDEQGRKRFHGAFTGGYSAGFYNTVGSLEGWTPSQFTSSREGRNNARSDFAVQLACGRSGHGVSDLEHVFLIRTKPAVAVAPQPVGHAGAKVVISCPSLQ